MHPVAPLRLARDYTPGIGQAVADRTINRMKPSPCVPENVRFSIPRDDTVSLDHQIEALMKSNGHSCGDELVYHVDSGDGDLVEGWYLKTFEQRRETWLEVSDRVAHGNSLLVDDHDGSQFASLQRHLRQGSTLMSGRHLQHGDETQPGRPIEVFTNCSTSAASHLTFLLLLSGSGVGRAYDDEMIVTDYSEHMPTIVCTIDKAHPDVASGEIVALTSKEARHLYANKEIVEFSVPDSREGWAQAVEMVELLTYQKIYKDHVLIIDFTLVRCKGSPIKGMQDRPASGPGPLMQAIENVARIKNSGMEPWLANLYVDHYLAECVLVGGARRAARMSTKRWTDPDVIKFINIKYGGFLWSSNNSVTVDAEFWSLVESGDENDPKCIWARKVFYAICNAAHNHGTGEPGFINQDMLASNDAGIENYTDGTFARSSLYQQQAMTETMMADLARRALKCGYRMITNPCGEIALFMLGGYCVIGDVVPYHAGGLGLSEHKNLNDWDDDAEDGFRATVRALMRTNLMNALYKKEALRTNRIGVSMTGVHEYAMARFGYGFKELIDEKKSMLFWKMLERFALAVEEECESYAEHLGVVVPHTNRTMKPAGTTSKLFSLTEGANLPAMLEYLRWVQYRSDDPLISELEDLGYPVKKLTTYNGTTVVGFPTQPEICSLAARLGLQDKIVTADQATPDEHYQWLRLLEKYWINAGKDESEITTGNQISYTLKYDPAKVSYDAFCKMILENQKTVRCCTVMPTLKEDESVYEYLPETAVSKAEYEMIVNAIKADGDVQEDVDFAHVDCDSGACPVDFNKPAVA